MKPIKAVAQWCKQYCDANDAFFFSGFAFAVLGGAHFSIPLTLVIGGSVLMLIGVLGLGGK